MGENLAERIHLLDGGSRRLTVRAYKSAWDIGAFIHVAWGGEAILERLTPRPVVWWDPGTWGGGSVWVAAGSPASFGLSFFDFNGATLPQQGTLAPIAISSAGYLKREVFLDFFGFPRPRGPDARTIARVTVTYTVPGEGGSFVLEQT